MGGAVSRCPRSIDCPDYQYGDETMGIDVQVQLQAFDDKALPWTTASLKEHNQPTPYENYTYYKPCTQNMTLDNYKEGKRCGMPLANQQWGPKFSAKDIVGLEGAVQSQLNARLAGVGMFTLDGCL